MRYWTGTFADWSAAAFVNTEVRVVPARRTMTPGEHQFTFFSCETEWERPVTLCSHPFNVTTTA